MFTTRIKCPISVATVAMALLIHPAIAGATPAGDAILATMSAEDKLYHKFMQIRVVAMVKVLRDNYVASQRYYDMMRQVTSGKGVAANLAAEIKGLQTNTVGRIQNQFANDWVADPAYSSNLDRGISEIRSNVGDSIGTKVNELVNQMTSYGSVKVQVADEMTHAAIASQRTGRELAVRADKVDGNKPVTNADLLKALSVQIQVQSQTNLLLAQLLDVNSHTAQVEMTKQAKSLRQAAIMNNVPLGNKERR